MISVVIPLYNKEQCIRKTIDSVLQQVGFSDFEIVVVDDGSTDRSCEIVESYNDKRIVLLHKENGGVSSARNMGAYCAKGDWLVFLDADDILFSKALELYNYLIKKYPKENLFAANFLMKINGKMKTKYMKKEYISENPLKDIALGRMYLRPGAFCINKHAFKVSGGYDERISLNEDREYGIRIASLYRVVYSPYIVMEYVLANNDARVKPHPLERNLVYYLSNINMSNWYVKYMYYKRINYSIYMYEKQGEKEAVGIIKSISNERFSFFFKFTCLIHEKIVLRMYRLFRI